MAFQVGLARKGFTLVELLVVVAIIALLLGILLPSLSKARKVTEQTLCGMNLRQWGTAVFQYQTEYAAVPDSHGHKRNLGGGRYGEYISANVSTMQRVARSNDPMRQEMITIQRMLPYMPGVDPDELVDFSNQFIEVSGPYICPGATRQSTAATPGWYPPGNRNWAHMHYTFIAGVDWDGLEEQGKALAVNSTGKLLHEDMTSDRLMMADDIFYLPSWNAFTPAYTYNHGRSGPAQPFYDANGMNQFTTTLADMAGVNHLYADGHVEWINEGGDELNTRAIMDHDPDVRYIKSNTGGSSMRWYY